MKRNINVEDRTENLHIKKLLPAHSLKIDETGLKIYRYWNLDIHKETKYKNDQDYVNHFLELFKSSIKVRMRGTEKVSAHLSGGLDSTGISCVANEMAEKLNKEFHTLSYTFPDIHDLKVPKNLYNFNSDIQKQVDFSKIRNAHFVTKPTKLTYIEKLKHEANVCDGMAWSNNVKTEYEIQDKARSLGVGVNLSGFLGDEIITSFCRAYYLEYLERGNYRQFFKSNTNGKPSTLEKLLLFGLKTGTNVGLPINNSFFARKYQDRKIGSKANHVSDYLFTERCISQYPDLRHAVEVENLPDIHQTIPLSFKEYQRNHINRLWTSRRIESENLAALNFRMEYRYPMADIRLLQYVLSLPIEQKRSDMQSRLLFRNSMKGYIIDGIRLGKKHNSFLKPMAHYYKLQGDKSLFNFWSQNKESGKYSFINYDLVMDNLNYNREILKLDPYAMIIKLLDQNKLTV